MIVMSPYEQCSDGNAERFSHTIRISDSKSDANCNIYCDRNTATRPETHTSSARSSYGCTAADPLTGVRVH